MKLEYYLKESVMKDFAEILLRECKPYFDEVKKQKVYLWRGTFTHVEDFSKRDAHLEDRKPMSTKQATHDLLNKEFQKLFGWKVRNGVFCHNSYPHTSGGNSFYGHAYLLCPIGQFEVAWHPKVIDFFAEVDKAAESLHDMEYRGIPVSQIKLNHGERIVELLMDTIREYRTDNFGKAGVNREISVKCEKYYLVNVHWLDWDRDVIEKYTGIRLDA